MGSNILYIEDNPDNMMLVKRALESRGYTLIEAKNGLDGVVAAEKNELDLILLDINLPDIDGYEVARAIRRSIPNGDMRLIAVTGYGQPSDKELAMRAGFDSHLLKPIAPEVLERLLAE